MIIDNCVKPLLHYVLGNSWLTYEFTSSNDLEMHASNLLAMS